jgi:hypothetical protein
MLFEKKKPKKDQNMNDAVESHELSEDLNAMARVGAIHKDPERLKKVRALAKQHLFTKKATKMQHSKPPAEPKKEMSKGTEKHFEHPGKM